MISWTKHWAPSDDGVNLKAADLRNIQDDVTSGTVQVALTPNVGDALYWNGTAWAPKTVLIDYVFADGELLAWENDAVYII